VPRIVIDQKNLRRETFRGSGKGGQHRNVTESGVRYTHLPTGIRASSCDERDQHANDRVAMRRLEEKLLAAYQRALFEDAVQKRVGQSKVSFGSQQRTYRVGGKDAGVIDHVTGLKVASVERVLDGDLDQLIRARLMS
jgi:peptide chain release factor 2